MQTASPFKTTDVATFIRETLPGAIKGKSPLHALFTSYNKISGFKDGPVETGKKASR